MSQEAHIVTNKGLTAIVYHTTPKDVTKVIVLCDHHLADDKLVDFIDSVKYVISGLNCIPANDTLEVHLLGEQRRFVLKGHWV